MNSAPRSRALSALFIAGLLLFSGAGCAGGPEPTQDEAPQEKEVEDGQIELRDSDIVPVGDSHVRGADDAWVTVVVFGDFEFPFSAQLAATLDEVQKSFDDGVVRLVFKHRPLEEHNGAMWAARAAEAAGLQGRFWEMHDALFDDFARLRGDDPEGVVTDIAAYLDLDLVQFHQDLTSDEVQRRVDEDLALARELDVDNVPAVFINGGYISGARAADVYQGAIQNVYQILRGAVETGEIERADVYRNSVQTLYAHTQPDEAPQEPSARAVVEIPVADRTTATSAIDEATVHVGAFVSFGDDDSLRMQRQLDAITEERDDVRVIYFHFLRQRDATSRLAHRALEGADSPDEVRRLVSWLSDEDNDWRNDRSLLPAFLDEEGIEPVDDEAFDNALRADIEAAQKFEVYTAPTIFVNGIREVGVADPAELEQQIDEQRALAIRVGSVHNLSGYLLYEHMVDGNRQRFESP